MPTEPVDNVAPDKLPGRLSPEAAAEVRKAVLDDPGFLRMTLSPLHFEGGPVWVKVSARPVEVQGKQGLQFVYGDGKKETTKNFGDPEAGQALDEALALPIWTLHVQTAAADLHLKVTRKGKTLTKRGRPSRAGAAPNLDHNRAKRQPLPDNRPSAFLQAIGVMNRRGRVRPSMRAKFNQINAFLRLLAPAVPSGGGPVRIVDFGCGAAYLTFAACHYLSDTLGRKVYAAGVDANAEIIATCQATRQGLGWDQPQFHCAVIRDFTFDPPPQITLSLHACDTATDEAIARGVRWGSRVILAAPCCQHELRRQLDAPLFRPLLRHGILSDRMADLLTDTFRAQALRVMGYRAEVIEFVSPEHTTKNLMIRAIKTGRPGDAKAVEEYEELKRYWGVAPAIERALAGLWAEAVSGAGER